MLFHVFVANRPPYALTISCIANHETTRMAGIGANLVFVRGAIPFGLPATIVGLPTQQNMPTCRARLLSDLSGQAPCDKVATSSDGRLCSFHSRQCQGR
jgi:hypothetical protein